MYPHLICCTRNNRRCVGSPCKHKWDGFKPYNFFTPRQKSWILFLKSLKFNCAGTEAVCLPTSILPRAAAAGFECVQPIGELCTGVSKHWIPGTEAPGGLFYFNQICLWCTLKISSHSYIKMMPCKSWCRYYLNRYCMAMMTTLNLGHVLFLWHHMQVSWYPLIKISSGQPQEVSQLTSAFSEGHSSLWTAQWQQLPQEWE